MLNFEIKGRGKSIVFLHGYLENLQMWENFTHSLYHDFSVVSIDLPGHGKSESFGEIHSMDLMAEKVKEVVDFLEISEIILVGHSMGGYVTLAFAEKYPEFVKGFILLNSSTFPDSELKKEQRLKAVDAAKRDFSTLVKVSVPSLFAQNNIKNLKEEISYTKDMALETSLAGVEGALKGMRDRPDRTKLLQSFKGEIGILIGEFDQSFDPKEFKKQIPSKSNIQILEIPTGHMAHLEAPKESLSFVRSLVEKVLKN